MNVETLLKLIEWGTIGVLFFLLVYSTMQRPSEMQKHIILLTISCILMIVGYMIEVDAPNLEVASLGAGISYLGKPFIMLSSYMLVCSFYGKKLRPITFVLLCIYSALFPVLVLTNDTHHLYYATVGYNADAMFTPLVITRGKMYFMNVLSAAVYFPSCIYQIVCGMRRSKSHLRNRLSLYLVLMVLSGVGGYALYIFKFFSGYDTTILGVSLGVMFLCILFFRCRIFDIVDISKDYALDSSSEGLLVFDESDDLAFANKRAENIIENQIPLSSIEKKAEGESITNVDGVAYSIKVNYLEKNGEHLGKCVEISDVTAQYNYQLELEKAVSETTEKLSDINRTIVASLASMVETRSLETGDHIRRVSEYTQIIAKELQRREMFADTISDRYINTLVLSAPLHDVGKVSVPDSILNKPGALTADEYEIMKKHTTDGAKVVRTTMQGLESDEYIDMAADIAMSHHERWDGTGYPNALSGDSIPLCARIVALADCYDALIYKRCYKDALSHQEAMKILQNGRGTQFDPQITDVFIDYLRTHNI